MIPVQQINRFVGLPYDLQAFDCADLAVLIQRELFGRDVQIGRRPKGSRTLGAFICRMSGQLAERIERGAVADGDVVLMLERGIPQHIGTLFMLGGVPYVLHASASVGFSLMQRLSDLPGYGLVIEGFYRWK